MLRRTVACLVCVISMSFVVPATSAAAVPATDELTAHVDASVQRVQAYTFSRSFADLRSAIDEMERAANLSGLRPETWVVQRRTFVRGWAQLLAAIEQSHDPTYDPNDPKDRPIMNLPEPQSFPDNPKTQAWAAVAIAANPKKLARAYYYHDLQIIDMRAQATMKAALDLWRRVEPNGTPADFEALDAILQQAGLSTARRTKIDAMFYERYTP